MEGGVPWTLGYCCVFGDVSFLIRKTEEWYLYLFIERIEYNLK